MPTYEYRCEKCDARLEVFAKMSDPPPAACEACGSSELVKVLFPVAVHYKGSGFYSTDYAGKGAPTVGEGGSSASSDSGSGSTSSDSGSGSSGSGGDSTPAPAPKTDSSSSSSSGSTGTSGGSSSSSSGAAKKSD